MAAPKQGSFPKQGLRRMQKSSHNTVEDPDWEGKEGGPHNEEPQEGTGFSSTLWKIPKTRFDKFYQQ